jgi:tetratricopeptide (TPR) repeat protein
MSDADLNKEAAQADSFYKAMNMVAALPLYEDLHQRQPQSYVWNERLAMCLLGNASRQPPAERAAMDERARKLLLEAKAGGDNSNLLQVLLEKLDQIAAAPATTAQPPVGWDVLEQGEKAFSTGDFAGALKLYQEAAAANPKLYEAPLFAGDAEFKQEHYAQADEWYARAVAIDPDRDTAYRYWGDSLMHLGNQTEAESKYIDAILAQPYTRAPRLSLQQWASSSHALLAAPPITLPARPTTDAKGNTNITIDASTLGNPASSGWLMYSMTSTVWQESEFKKHYPDEKQYRHSLAEEVAAIQGVLEVVREQKIPDKKLDATLKSLVALDKDGMLECWILLDHPDQGIAQDYVAFRATHRDLLHAYIAKYDIHPN